MLKSYTRFFKVVSLFLKIGYEANKTLLFLTLLLPLILGVVPIIDAYLFKQLIDLLVNEGFDAASKAAPILVALIGTKVAADLIGYFLSYTGTLFRDEVAPFIQKRFYGKIARLSYQDLSTPRISDMIYQVELGIDWRPLSLMSSIPDILISLVTIIISLPIILKFAWWLVPVLILFNIPSFLVSLRIAETEFTITDSRSKYSRQVHYLSNILRDEEDLKELRIFGVEKSIFKTIMDFYKKFATENKQMERKNLTLRSLGGLSGGVNNALIFGLVFYRAIQRSITIGQVSFYLSIFSELNHSLSGMLRSISRMNSDVINLGPVLDFLALPEEVVAGEELDEAFKTLELNNVSFNYPETNHLVFDGLNLTINKGDKVAIVGLNGAGKTTLINLILRLFDPTEGEILINGKNITSIKRTSWFDKVGVLFQHFNKYRLTVRENIKFGSPEKEDEALYERSKDMSDSREIVDAFEHKDDQQLGAQFGGIDLSGGQWQRIALARMYYRDSEILILDEPTASIDAVSEAKIFENVQNLSKDKTVIIISHRFSTVRKADRIIVLDQGKIIEDGSHQELIEQNGTYARMYNLQAEGYR